ncbi:aldehyde dehydrogenase family protein [bacterium]|nr:aldehyde dehydrogenase family protein [bacterium]
MADIYKNYINGEWVDSSSGETFENRNPANHDEVVGIFPKSTQEDADRAIAAAKEAQAKWRLVPAPERGKIMRKVGDLMVQRKEELARLMTREMGKVINETRGDVQEGIDTAYYAEGESRRLFAEAAPSELPNKWAFTTRLPIGVAGIITPWNFPVAIPTWKMFPAITCGNAVVFKPATDTPACGGKLVEIMTEAGVPKGVVNIVYGSGRTVGMRLVEHPDVRAISFTGSSDIGKIINAKGGQQLKRISLELGGKNAQLVMDDANLELALDGVLWGAFGTTGQRCTATSRLLLHKDIHDKFVEMLVERVNKLKLGNGLDESVEVGPLVNEAQQKTIDEYCSIGKEEGAEMVCGGKIPDDPELAKGWFYKPTVFINVKRTMRIFQEEIFGPVLSISKINSFEEGVEHLNDSVYGLSSSIYTQDINNAFRAIRDFQAGITYVNGPTIGAECHFPFGGVKETGNGHREGGWTVYDFFTEWKTIYVDFSGKLQRAQIDNY